MNLTLQRTDYREDGIFGVLSKDDNDPIAVTLEHAFPNGIMTDSYKPKLAAGTYTCARHAPNRLPYETFEVMNVPNFQGKPVTGILIHVGNYNKDSDGCILVGRRVLPNPAAPASQMITSSENTFNKIKDYQVGLEQFTLTVKDKS